MTDAQLRSITEPLRKMAEELRQTAREAEEEHGEWAMVQMGLIGLRSYADHAEMVARVAEAIAQQTHEEPSAQEARIRKGRE